MLRLLFFREDVGGGGCSCPFLYTVRAEVSVAGREVDLSRMPQFESQPCHLLTEGPGPCYLVMVRLNEIKPAKYSGQFLAQSKKLKR